MKTDEIVSAYHETAPEAAQELGAWARAPEARPSTPKIPEVVTTPPVVGRKNDSGKAQWSLLPWDAVREIVHVLTHGAKEYAPGNWVHVPDARDRYFDALMRHLTTWYYDGEEIDPQFGLHHLAHAGCDLLFLLALSLRGKFKNDAR